MDFSIRSFTVSEQMLFNFPEYVDLLLKENLDVKDAGVFKVHCQHVVCVSAKFNLFVDALIDLFFYYPGCT